MVGLIPPSSDGKNSQFYYDFINEDSQPLLCENYTEKMTAPSVSIDCSDHCHRPEPDRTTTRQAQRQLSIACCLCLLFVIGEILGGYYSGSLAIMADAAHMFSDFASFGVSLFVIWLSGKKAQKSMTFGYYRAEALGALATVVIIWYVTGILTYLAIERLQTGVFEIHDNAMVAVASAAVVFNVTLGLCLHGMCCTKLTGMHGHSHSHSGHDRLREEGDVEVVGQAEKHINIRAALIHVLGDLLQSIGVLFSSILIKIFGDSCKIVDPICTLLFACIVILTTLTVLRDTLRILLEGTPRNIVYDAIRDDLMKISDVSAVHDLHLWSLTADLPAASVHLVVGPQVDQTKVLLDANRVLKDKNKILKSTVQIEVSSQTSPDCARCQPLNS